MQAGPHRGRTAPGPRAPEPTPTPYLAVVGAPPLRFAEPAPPPDLTTRPPAAAPPRPALTPTEETVAAENITAAKSVAEGAPATTPPTPLAETAPTAADTPLPAPTKVPPAILPDDNRPPVRAEDFLPFFQIPGSSRRASDVMLVAPVPPGAPTPAPLPPSSATYNQSK